MPEGNLTGPGRDLAAERVERLALAEMHAAAPDAARRALGLELHEIGGALVSVAAHDPSILWNRSVGLGLDAPATDELIRAIRGIYARAGIGRFFLNVHPAAQPDDIAARLDAAGLEQQRRWMKFERDASPAKPAETDLAVREIGPEHAADAARILAGGFDLTEAAQPLLAALIGRPGWHAFMSFDGDTPAGAGTLFVHDGVGVCEMAATDPAFRGRGAQQAVLAARIEKARARGCSVMFTMTGEAVPGDPQHSYRNIMRAGFREGYLRDNWAPAGSV